jgi:hypothetical protein
MKKALLLILLLLLLVSCKESSKKETPNKLSELRAAACNKADEAETCDTRLIEVGIVLKEECCNILGKCC